MSTIEPGMPEKAEPENVEATETEKVETAETETATASSEKIATAKPGAAKPVKPAKPAKAVKPATSAKRGRTGLRRTASIVSAVGVLALTTGVVLAQTQLDPPGTVSRELSALQVPPTEVFVTCAGGLLAAPGSSTGTDSELGGASEISSVTAALTLPRDGARSPATLASLDGATATPLTAGTDVDLLASVNAASSSVLRADPVGEEAAFPFGASVVRADGGDSRGLMAASCTPSSSTTWLAGGRTEIGSSALLVLRNPGSTAASVTITAWGPTGGLAVGGGTILVPAQSESVQVLEALVPQVDKLVLRVDSVGGQVSAVVQTSALTGLTPAGTDLVVPTLAPMTDQVIPGVVLTTSTLEDPDPSAVRLLNAGTEPATVHLSLLGPDAVVNLTDELGVIVEAGAVSDVSLAGAPPGNYALHVVSDQPVVAGAELVRVGLPAPEDPDVPVADRAWLPAVEPVESAAIALPGLGSLVDGAALVLANPGDAVAQVSLRAIGADGAMLEVADVSVPAGLSLSLDVAQIDQAPELTALIITSSEPVSSAITLTYGEALGQLIAVVTATLDPQVERSATVRVGLS